LSLSPQFGLSACLLLGFLTVSGAPNEGLFVALLLIPSIFLLGAIFVGPYVAIERFFLDMLLRRHSYCHSTHQGLVIRRRTFVKTLKYSDLKSAPTQLSSSSRAGRELLTSSCHVRIPGLGAPNPSHTPRRSTTAFECRQGVAKRFVVASASLAKLLAGWNTLPVTAVVFSHLTIHLKEPHNHHG
jgi:hypothetical protein